MVDISPTVVAGGKVIVKRLRGQSLPEGWIMDGEGRGVTDPAGYFGPPPGSLLPLGGHKGYALGIVVDILAGALSGGNCSGPGFDRWGNPALILAVSAPG